MRRRAQELLGDEGPAVCNSRFGAVLDIPFVRFKISRPITLGNLAVMNLRRTLGLARSDGHRFLRGVSAYRGLRFGFVQLLTQRGDLFLDHFLERRLRNIVIGSNKDESRDTGLE